MNNKIISVIVPIYKVEQYLNKCIKSIVDQTYKELEIILVDDGSPDNCPEICDKWAKKDKRIKVIHKKNGGLSDARNAGINIATGNYISFIDSDDWIQSDFLEKLYMTLIDKDADIVECGVRYVDEEGNLIKERKASELILEISKIEALRRLVLEKDVYQTVWNKLYKRKVIDKIQFELGKCNEDEFWTYQVMDRINKLVVIQDSLYCYLQRSSSIMGQKYSLKRIDGLQARFKRMEYLQKYDELAVFTQELIRYDCLYHFQAAIKWLEGDEQKIVTDFITLNMQNLCKIRMIKSTINIKYKVWFTLFEIKPFAIAKLRNHLKIGV